ncbi:MAG TPA: restriction endonuclease subunit S, partial [Flavobacterium sp.]|nr:restriction endonuclease subunit S [Flavobacterium sp.]
MKQKTQYKITSVGPIPSDWKVKKLNELGIFSKGKGILKEQVVSKGYPCIRYGEIYTTHNYIINEFKSFINETVTKESKEIKKGDILFAGSGETIEEIGKSVAYVGNEKAYAGGDIIILSLDNNLSTEFLSYALESDYSKKQKRIFGQGNSVVHIYSSDLSKLRIALPPLSEQQKIAKMLTTWDKAIQETGFLIEKLEIRNKALAFSLFRGKLVSKKSKKISLGKFLAFTPREVEKPRENYLAL